jgi:hypothetical protein
MVMNGLEVSALSSREDALFRPLSQVPLSLEAEGYSATKSLLRKYIDRAAIFPYILSLALYKEVWKPWQATW